jgi:periplasmic divalent cation tolerance protein
MAGNNENQNGNSRQGTSNNTIDSHATPSILPAKERLRVKDKYPFSSFFSQTLCGNPDNNYDIISRPVLIFVVVGVSKGMIINPGTKMKFVVVNTTIDSARAAEKLAGLIVKNRLAACVQSVPIRSIYTWKGKVEKAKEYLLLAKTRASLAGKLTAFIRKHHPYDVPEIVVTRISGGLKDYLAWIDAETRK